MSGLGSIIARQNQDCAAGIRVTSNPYYSRGKVRATRTGSGPYTFTVAAGYEVRFFGYARGQDMAAAGVSGTTATAVDTNLQNAGQTISGQTLKIERMGLQVGPLSDGELASQVLSESSIILSMNGGEQQLYLGNALMWPGGSGLMPANTALLPTDFAQSPAARVRMPAANGLQGYDNLRPFPEGVIWTPDGSQDSNLNIILRVERAVTLTVTERTAAAPSNTNSTGQTYALTPFLAPESLAALVDIWCCLYGTVTGPRSDLT